MNARAYCDQCGTEHDINALDAKPVMTLWLCIVWLFIGQNRGLAYAGERGHDFDRYECRRCYGPGYAGF